MDFLAEGVGFEPTCLSANGFQDRLVMTTSITLRKYDATACIIFTELVEMWLGELLLGESASHTPPEDRQARLSGAGRGYIRHRRNTSL